MCWVPDSQRRLPFHLRFELVLKLAQSHTDQRIAASILGHYYSLGHQGPADWTEACQDHLLPVKTSPEFVTVGENNNNNNNNPSKHKEKKYKQLMQRKHYKITNSRCTTIADETIKKKNIQNIEGKVKNNIKFGMMNTSPTDECTSRWKIRERGKSGKTMWGNKDWAMAHWSTRGP